MTEIKTEKIGFKDLGIKAGLVQALADNGITEPTQIQIETLPLLLRGDDVVAQGQTGTGKTLAFILPMLQKIDSNSDQIQGLIIAPTRELALQITEELKKLADPVNAKVLACYGGQDVERQIIRLRARQIVVGTPGRILEHVRRRTINLSQVNMLVLDEADTILQMGFQDEVEEIMKVLAGKRQTMLFSATIPKHVRLLSEKYMRKAKHIQVKVSKKVTLDEIDQVLIPVNENQKVEVLAGLIDTYRPYLAMVFCRTKDRAKEVNYELGKLGYNVDVIHGELSQLKREQVMKNFREAKLQILVASDIAARGIDVEGVTHVFSYDIARSTGAYIHRIGRTGRAGDTGMAVTLLTPDDQMILEKIEKGIAFKIERRERDGITVIRDKAKISRTAMARKPGQKASPGRGKSTGKGKKGGKTMRQDGSQGPRPKLAGPNKGKAVMGQAPKAKFNKSQNSNRTFASQNRKSGRGR